VVGIPGWLVVVAAEVGEASSGDGYHSRDARHDHLFPVADLSMGAIVTAPAAKLTVRLAGC